MRIPWYDKNLRTKKDIELFNNYKEMINLSKQIEGFMESIGFKQQ